MQGESTLVGADVEGASASVAFSGGLVFALIEKSSGLLSCESVKIEAESVHGNDGRGLRRFLFGRVHDLRLARRELFEFADTGIAALDDGVWRKLRGERLDDGFANGVGVHGLREQLKGDDVVVLVGHKAWELIGFAEDHSIRVTVGDHAAAIGNGFGQTMTDEIDEI